MISPPTPSEVAVNAMFLFKKWGKMCGGSVGNWRRKTILQNYYFFTSILLSSWGNCFFFFTISTSDLRVIFDFVLWTKILILGCVSSTYFQAVIIKFTSSILFDNTFLINHQLQTLWKQLWALTMRLR